MPSGPLSRLVRRSYAGRMSEISREEAEAFVRAVVQLASMADRVLPHQSSPLTARLAAHLGGVGEDVSSTSMSLPVIERVNVQLAPSTRTARKRPAST